MKPDDVPDELVEIAKAAQEHLAETAPLGEYTHEAIKRAMLAAAWPEIERQVRADERAKVVAELERASDTCSVHETDGMIAAIDTVRGGA